MSDETKSLQVAWDIPGVGKIPGADKIIPKIELPSIGGAISGAADAGKFSLYMGRIESKLDDLGPEKMKIEPGKASEVLKFMQNALANLELTDVKADGKSSAQFIEDLNGYIKAKQGESDNLGDYSKLPLVKDASEISGAHLQAIVDSLRDKDLLNRDNAKALEAFGKVLGAIGDKSIIEDAKSIGIPVPAEEGSKPERRRAPSWGNNDFGAPTVA